MLVNEGPDRVRELMEICPRFDRVDGQIVLGREGAHSVPRVVHAGGDATGSEVSSALAEAARVGSRVQLYENEFVIDLLTVDGRCVGALSLNLDDGGLTLNVAMVTILATGGAGQVYGRTTNPAGRDRRRRRHGLPGRRRHPRPRVRAVPSHGPGVAGPADRPAHHRGAARRGRLPAQRRRRALHDRRTTSARELASRDVVVRGMVTEMRREDTDHVYLDATHLDAACCRSASRGSRAACASTAWTWPRSSSRWRRSVTTSSAASSRTCGDAPRCPACTPAARWPAPACTAPTASASNSLLEGLVFSDRVVRDLDRYIGRLGEDVRRLRFDLPEAAEGGGDSDASAARHRLTDVMQRQGRRAAPRRRPAGGARRAGGLTSELRSSSLGVADYELLNLLTLGRRSPSARCCARSRAACTCVTTSPTVDDERWRAPHAAAAA